MFLIRRWFPPPPVPAHRPSPIPSRGKVSPASPPLPCQRAPQPLTITSPANSQLRTTCAFPLAGSQGEGEQSRKGCRRSCTVVVFNFSMIFSVSPQFLYFCARKFLFYDNVLICCTCMLGPLYPSNDNTIFQIISVLYPDFSAGTMSHHNSVRWRCFPFADE